MWKLSAVATLLCALTSVASAYRPGDEVCSLSESNQCAADSITPSALDGSVLIYPGGKTRCAFDDFTDPNGSFSANKTYFFQVFPKQEKKTKLMIYFQGGGACTGSDTCGFSLQCSLGASSTFTTTATATSSGLLNRTNPDNLFKDWNIVHIPYCTGDLHVGNAVRNVGEGAFEAILNQPQCLGQNVSTHMVGYENTQAALKWALANYPNPEHLIVGGASAGSLAAQIVSALVADMWKVQESSIRYSVLADSYVGVLPEDKSPSSVVLDYYGVCDVNVKLPTATVSACKTHTLTFGELVSALLKEVPFSDWLFIDSKADETQRYFYQLVKDGILGFPFPNLISGDAFFKGMDAMIDAYKTVSSRISTFFIEGDKHVFLRNENYTSVVSASGELLGEFLSDWLLLHSDPSVAPTPAPAVSPAPAATPTSVQVPGATPAPASGVSPTPASSTPSVRPGC